MVSFRLLIPPLADVPPGFPRVVLLGMFFIAIVFSGWVMFDTQRAMVWIASRAPEWWPGRATGIRLANKPAWVWFYRIDCAVVFFGCVLTLVTSLIKILTR